MRPERGHRCDADKQHGVNRAEILEQIFECHLFDDILSRAFSMENPDRRVKKNGRCWPLFERTLQNSTFHRHLDPLP
jgi:hypothetical protein